MYSRHKHKTGLRSSHVCVRNSARIRRVMHMWVDRWSGYRGAALCVDKVPKRPFHREYESYTSLESCLKSLYVPTIILLHKEAECSAPRRVKRLNRQISFLIFSDIDSYKAHDVKRTLAMLPVPAIKNIKHRLRKKLTLRNLQPDINCQ